MAIVRAASVIQWQGQIVVTALARTSSMFRVPAAIFGPLREDDSDRELSLAVRAALDHDEPHPDEISTSSTPLSVQALGARSESELYATGQSAEVSRRDGVTTVRARGTDGDGWVRMRDMPSVALDVEDPTTLGAAVREMLAAFTRLEPEESSHT